MSEKQWEPIKFCYCQHVASQVALEAEMVYPAEWLPDLAPRVTAHRCSRGIECNLDGRWSCMWAGTNPAVDPFNEAG